MFQQFLRNIKEQHLFSPEQEVLLAVSGGRDSVALVHLMKMLGNPFAIAHCNFKLRGEESDRDEAFVCNLANSLSVMCHTVSFDTTAYAKTHGESIEEAARHLRYEWFAELCSTHYYSCLVTAHHLDDSIETVFLNLLRGTGLQGMHGILPISEMHFRHGILRVVRPLLSFSRDEIDTFVSKNSLQFVEDSTNDELNARRNILRLRVFPILKDEFPTFRSVMQSNIERFLATEHLYSEYINNLKTRLFSTYQSRVIGNMHEYLALQIDRIEQYCEPETLLYELLRPYGFDFSTVCDLLRKPHRSGALFISATHEATFNQNILYIGERDDAAPKLTIRIDSMDGIPSVELLKRLPANEIIIDESKVSLPLKTRTWNAGDRFYPFGMNQAKLVSDFLKDQKLILLEKKKVEVLVDSLDRIIWVVGLRLDNRFCIDANSTSSIKITVR